MYSLVGQMRTALLEIKGWSASWRSFAMLKLTCRCQKSTLPIASSSSHRGLPFQRLWRGKSANLKTKA